MSTLPAETSDYAKATYWKSRFESERQYEWFCDYSAFRHLLRPHVSSNARILLLGNGTSNLPRDLLLDGCRHITVTDVCPALIENLRSHDGTPGVAYEVADVCQLPYDEGRFDVVIEKGVLDVLCSEAKSPWDPPPVVQERMAQACKEIHRVLSTTGLFCSVTFSQPHFRRPFFQDLPWSCEVVPFGEPGCLEYFVYRLRKGEEARSERTAPSRELLQIDPMHKYLDQPDFLNFIDL